MRNLLAQVDVNPNPRGLPGGAQIQAIVDGISYYALVAALAAFLTGMALMAFGSLSSNPRSSALGKSAGIVSILAAFGIGAAAAIVNFFYGSGGGVN